MNNFEKVCIWLGLICVVIAGFLAHDVSKWAFLLILGLYVPLCVFCTDTKASKPMGFFMAALATLVVMLLLKLNAHYAFMAIPALALVGYSMVADRDCLSSIGVWLSAIVWAALLFFINCLMFLLV